MFRWLGSIAALAALASPCLAEPTQVTAEYHSGGPTPLGYYGVALDVQPLSWLSASGGVGLMNFQGSSQLQVAVAPRLRWPVLPWLALDAGAAFSRGQRSDYVPLSFEQILMGTAAVTRSWTYRLGPELGIELAPLPRTRLRLYGGLAFPLEEAHCATHATETGVAFSGGCRGPMIPAQARDSQSARPYLGLAVGWTVLGPERANLLPSSRWYGWQMMLADTGAGILLLASDPYPDAGGSPLSYAAKQQLPVVFLASGPLVHLAHRRPLTAVSSLFLRGAAVLVGWAIGQNWNRSECVRLDCRSNQFMVVGGGLAAAADAAFLAWSERAP
jgi:hypothetical protein